MNPIARSSIDAQLKQSPAQRLAIPEVSRREPINPGHNLCPRPVVLQSSQPLAEHIPPGPGQVTANFYHYDSVTYKSYRDKGESFRPLPFQQLTSVKSSISPLNPDFLPFIAFFVRNVHGFNRITMTHSTHRNFWVSQVGFFVDKSIYRGSRTRDRGDRSNS